MFLKYLSDKDCEEEYQPFVFQFETLVAGVVSEVSKRASAFTDIELGEQFVGIFAKALDVKSNFIPNNWWNRVKAPSLEWFQAYLIRELPFMIAEARRLGSIQSLNSEKQNDLFDKAQIRRIAHQNSLFHEFLLANAEK